MTFSRYLVFYNGSYYYSVSPNPTNGPITVRGDKNKKMIVVQSDQRIVKRDAMISAIEVYDFNSRLIHRTEYNNETDSAELDLSDYRAGIYYIYIFNEDILTTHKIQKI